MNQYSLKDIIRSFDQKRDWERQFPINFYIIRPLSFPLTFIILRLTQSPEKVAWTGFAIGIIGCLMFLGISCWTAWPGIIFVLLYSLFDAVDGNIARTTGNVTYYGKFLDGLLGETIEAGYCFFIGLGLSGGLGTFSIFGSNPATPAKIQLAPLICGAVIMSGRFFSSFIDLKYEYHAFESQAEKNTPLKSIYDEIQSSTFRDNWLYQVFINCNLLNNQIVLLMLCMLFFNITLALYLLALYYIARTVTYFVFFLVRARQRLT
jgi:phosphatidylglycerophosphate synthase